MRPYESLIIFDAELEEPAIAGVLDRATELVRAGGGERNQLDRWGKRAFAYEMKHRREGYYVVMEYSAEPATAAEIDRLLDLADEVLRHKTVRLPDKLGSRTTKAQGSRAESGPGQAGPGQAGPGREGARTRETRTPDDGPVAEPAPTTNET